MIGFESTTLRATVAAAHAAPFPDVVRRAIWFVEPTDSAIVLGSTQPLSVLDLAEVERRRLAVVRRRSGGGAVVIEAGASSWFDVWLPADDPRFERDVSRSSTWLGEAVADALGTAGVDGDVVVASGVQPGRPGARSPVCFGSVGPGEVLVEGRKVVGVSQRRTRAGARFQVLVLHRFDPVATAALFASTPETRARLVSDLGRRVAGVRVAPGVLRAAVEDALSRR